MSETNIENISVLKNEILNKIDNKKNNNIDKYKKNLKNIIE